MPRDVGALYGYKKLSLTELITQPSLHIIRYRNLSSLKIDDALSINRLILLSSGVGG